MKTIEEKIKELRDDIEYHEMQYQIAEEHPTYTEQFSEGQRNVREKLRLMKKELVALEKPLLDNK